ncbi:MAG TPA: hypothetical protein VGU66_22730 [Candidatus Elarobacter sp.]|nr:hypothetical protein [Candidatus Elarobacter sp.]
MDVPPGWEPYGEPITIKLKRPCPGCRYDGDVSAQPIVRGNDRRLPTRCPRCRQYFQLSIREYGATVGWSQAKSAPARRGPAWSPRDHQVFARYNWCCVYHEGSAEAALFRGKQIDALGIAATASTLAAEPALLASARALARPLRVDPNLFGLVPDHLIPKAVQELLDDRWTAQQRDLMAREWIVAACGRCNGQRNQELETAQQLLYIFSRFVLPHRPGEELERLRETFCFVEVLDTIETYRVENGIREPLRPLRLARNSEIETG